MKTIFNKSLTKIRACLEDEDGAVAIDWIVLTAGLVGVSTGAGVTILEATQSLSDNISSGIEATSVDNGQG